MSDSFNAYGNIINRKNGVDRLGDTVENMQIKNPITPKQRSYNALMGGFGAGLKGSQDRVREGKAEELETQLKNLVMLDKELKMKMGQNQLREETYKDFAANNYYDIQALNDAREKGDEGLQDRYVKTLFNSLRKSNPEMAKQIGEPIGVKGDNILFEQADGSIRGDSIKNVFSDIIARMPEEQQRNLKHLQTSHMVKAFEDRDRETVLKQSKTEAEIGKLNADARHLETQKNVSKIDTDAIKDHRKYIQDTIEPRLTANKKLLGLYDNLVNIVNNNPNLVGRDLQTKVRRGILTYFGRGDEDIDYTNLKSVEFEKNLRPILGGQFGEREGKRVLGKFASLDNNIDGLSKFLEEEIPETNRLIRSDQNRLQSFNEIPNRNIHDPKLEATLDDVGGKQSLFVRPETLSPESIEKIENKILK